MSGRRVTDPDEEFNKIVEGLELEVPPSLDVEEPQGRHPSDPTFQPEPKRRAPAEHDDEIAYRTPSPRPKRPPSKARACAWVAVLAGPGLLVTATLMGILLPRIVVLAAALIFVAAVIYLISQLPEHGPSHPDWPDDGAVL